MSPKKNKENKENIYIFENIEEIQKQLNVINNMFNMETDEYLIDSYIYQIQSLNKRYQYFLKQAKKMGITADGFSKMGGERLCSRPL